MRVMNGERRAVLLPNGIEVLAGIQQVVTTKASPMQGAPSHEIAYFPPASGATLRPGDVITAGVTRYRVTEVFKAGRADRIRRVAVLKC